MVAGALVMAWFVVSSMAALLIGAAIDLADRDAHLHRHAEPFRIP